MVVFYQINHFRCECLISDLCEGGSRIADIVLKSGRARDVHTSTV